MGPVDPTLAERVLPPLVAAEIKAVLRRASWVGDETQRFPVFFGECVAALGPPMESVDQNRSVLTRNTKQQLERLRHLARTGTLAPAERLAIIVYRFGRDATSEHLQVLSGPRALLEARRVERLWKKLEPWMPPGTPPPTILRRLKLKRAKNRKRLPRSAEGRTFRERTLEDLRPFFSDRDRRLLVKDLGEACRKYVEREFE